MPVSEEMWSNQVVLGRPFERLQEGLGGEGKLFQTGAERSSLSLFRQIRLGESQLQYKMRVDRAR